MDRYARLLLLLCLAYQPAMLAQPTHAPQNLSKPLPSAPAVDDVPEIAISLDDAPTPGTVLFGGVAKTQAIIQQLQAVSCPAVGIFAIGVHAAEGQNMERLRMYGEAGHIIANHTYSHCSLNRISPQNFIQDVQRAHACFQALPNFRPWLRFPFLHEGKTIAQRQAVMQALEAMGYQEGYITVSNDDWYINGLVIKAAQAGKQINYAKLKKIYLRILWDCIATYEQLARKVFKRKVKHVLLLHENDLAALFIGDLIEHIRSQGWRVIAIEEAYQDSMAMVKLMTNYGYTGRITATGVEKGLGKSLVDFPPTTHRQYITEALERAKVFIDP